MSCPLLFSLLRWNIPVFTLFWNCLSNCWNHVFSCVYVWNSLESICAEKDVPNKHFKCNRHVLYYPYSCIFNSWYRSQEYFGFNDLLTKGCIMNRQNLFSHSQNLGTIKDKMNKYEENWSRILRIKICIRKSDRNFSIYQRLCSWNIYLTKNNMVFKSNNKWKIVWKLKFWCWTCWNSKFEMRLKRCYYVAWRVSMGQGIFKLLITKVRIKLNWNNFHWKIICFKNNWKYV